MFLGEKTFPEVFGVCARDFQSAIAPNLSNPRTFNAEGAKQRGEREDGFLWAREKIASGAPPTPG
jgi:hypothetical protein